MDELDQPRPLTGVGRSNVELRVPADSAYVLVLRTTAAGLAARVDFTIDDIEDFRMAINEACALVLPVADPGSDLVAEFFLGPRTITASVSVASRTPTTTDPGSWAWQVLDALTAEASQSACEGRFTITITMHSALTPRDV
jgi:serine/threonine-protein kinase RsbW